MSSFYGQHFYTYQNKLFINFYMQGTILSTMKLTESFQRLNEFDTITIPISLLKKLAYYDLGTCSWVNTRSISSWAADCMFFSTIYNYFSEESSHWYHSKKNRNRIIKWWDLSSILRTIHEAIILLGRKAVPEFGSVFY